MRQDRCATCTVVSFFSHYRCLRMPQLTMHSLVMEAAVNPEAFTQVRAMPPRRITAPEELTTATELTAQSCCIANPNGGKLSAVGTSRRRFERRHNEGDDSLGAPLLGRSHARIFASVRRVSFLFSAWCPPA